MTRSYGQITLGIGMTQELRTQKAWQPVAADCGGLRPIGTPIELRTEIGSLQLEACNWKSAVGSLQLEACSWKPAIGSLQLGGMGMAG